MKATRIHYFFAGDWPGKIWTFAFTASFAVAFGIQGWPTLVSPAKWTDPLLFIGYVLLSGLLGWFVGLLVGWPVIGPLYYERGQRNGEPFHEGDWVRILVGPHRDRIVRVSSAFDIADWAGSHRIRVDLGPDTKDDENVFHSYQILRVSERTQEKRNEREPTG